MSVAYKCNRCGKLYSSPDPTIKIKGIDIPLYSIPFVSGSWNSNQQDLCPTCAQDFVIWWEHSNISASYELDKMRALARLTMEAIKHDSNDSV